MSDETPPALPPPQPAQKHTHGLSKITLLALVISLAALGFSIYGLCAQLEPRLPPLPAAPPDISDLENRMQQQETRQGQFAEDIAKVTAHFSEAVSNQPSVQAPSAPADVEALKQKLGSVEKDNAAMQSELRATLLHKTRLLADFAVLQSIRLKLRDGVEFANDRKALSADAPPAPLENIDISNPAPLSDKSLRDDLRQLAPHFSSIEKLGAAKGFFQQLAVRAEDIVSIRPKEGLAVAETPSGKNLAALQDALNAHAWPAALAVSDALSQKSPVEFTAWQTRLKTRSDAEAALDVMEAGVLASLRDEAPKPEAQPAPAATPAPAANEASP